MAENMTLVLDVESCEVMVRSLQDSLKRQAKLAEETRKKLKVAESMLEVARARDRQSDLVAQAAPSKR